MAKAVIMPKFEMSQETGTVVRWLKKEGDKIKKGDALLEVETDKVVMEVEAPDDGILAGVSAKEGDVVPVTTTIAYLLADGESLPSGTAPTPAPASTPAAVVSPTASVTQPTVVQSAPSAVAATPVAEKAARAANVDLSLVPALENGARITRKDVEDYLRAQAESGGAKRATPAARRVARESGVDIKAIAGSGPRGRVQEADVRAFTPSAAVQSGVETQQPLSSDEIIPLQGIRKRIAERMTLSYQSAPHIMLTVEADMSAAMAWRAQTNAQREAQGKPKLSVTALIVKAVAAALKKNPYINAALLEDGIHLKKAVNIGVAVALENGLIVPVIRDADRISAEAVNEKVDELARKARQNQLLPSDVSASTFTISNLGMFGVDHFTAIINPPEVGILAVGRVVKRAVVVEEESGEESLRIRPMMAMTLSVDHRVADGASGAQFLKDLVLLLQEPKAYL